MILMGLDKWNLELKSSYFFTPDTNSRGVR
nr:MAG TPA: hypothetical protein [Bacteriophage sp.]